MTVQEGDRIKSPHGRTTRVYDVATCTETGSQIVIHGTRVQTFTTPLERVERAYRIIEKGGERADP